MRKKTSTAAETVKNEQPITKTAAADLEVKTAAETAAPTKKTRKAAAAAKEVKPRAKRNAAKAVAKSDNAPAAAETARKKPGRKPKPVTIDVISAKLSKLVNKTKAAEVKGAVAVDVEVWGWDDGANRHLYIEVLDGKVTVAPYSYDDRNLEAYISFADANDLVNGKLTVKDAFASGKLNASGDVRTALIIASLF